MSDTRPKGFDRRILWFAGVVLLVLIGYASWQLLGAGDPHTAEDRLVVHSAGTVHVFEIELVDTDEARAQGLMFRQELAPNAGMLFDFFEERPVAFWMENTYIPLDMIFVRANGEIARIHENAIPLDRTSIPSGEPVRFVLEIPGGRSAELGIAEGDLIEHPRIEP